MSGVDDHLNIEEMDALIGQLPDFVEANGLDAVPRAVHALGIIAQNHRDELETVRLEDATTAVDAGLVGRDPAMTAACGKVLARYTDTMIDVVALDLMVRTGIDPVVAIAYAISVADVAREQAVVYGDRMHADGASGMVTMFEIDDGITVVGAAVDISVEDHRMHWCRGSLSIGSLPETIRSTLPGRPLRDLVSHPVLDALAPTIIEAETDPESDPPRVVVRTDHVVRTIPLSQVAGHLENATRS